VISVVIPCYNAAATLREAVESALVQDVDKEIIVVDDGSTDGSAAAIASLGAAVRAIATPNRGASAARQTGAEAARGDFVQYLDSDDLLAPGALATRLAALAASGGDVAHQDWQRLEPDGAGGFAPGEVRRPPLNLIAEDAEAATATAAFWAPPAALLYSRAMVEKIGPWPANLPVIQDARYLFEAARHGARFAYAPGVGAFYRVSAGSLSHGNRARFVHDCAVNAAEVEALWRADPAPLPETRRRALAAIWDTVASASLNEGLGDFETALAGLRRAGQARAALGMGGVLRRVLGPGGAAGALRLARRAGSPLRRHPEPEPADARAA
jgi:glycosyltransferase involved in cell wall biosynthesis